MTSISHRKQTQPSFIMLLVPLMLFTYSAFSVQAAPGDLDLTFGNGGKVITSFTGAGDFALAIAIQPDGKMIAAGDVRCGTADGFDVGPCSPALARYNSNGTLDASFGVGGKVTTDEGSAGAVALQPDGKIIVAGSIQQPNNSSYHDFMLMRFNTDGTRDLSFGTNGQVNTDFFNIDIVYAVACQPDGKLVAVGEAQGDNGTSFALARYNSDGTLDTAFGTGGKVSLGSPYAYGLHAVVLQPDGKIVAAGGGGAPSDFALLRFNTDGSPDSTFGTGGLVLTPISSSSDVIDGLALQPDGKIVVAGRGGNFTTVRYNPNGKLDQTFGQNGIVVTSLLNPGYEDRAYAVVIQPNGKIVVAGAADTYRFGLVRYNPNGSLDSTFGTGGIVTTQLTTGPNAGGNILFDLAIQPDGKLLAVGYAEDSNNYYFPDFALARYNGDPVVASASAHDVLISEFRLRGNAGANDEFIELYNNTDTNLVVTTSDGSAGWSLVAADGVTRFIIPFNTAIPARGHYLATNASGYNLAAYPAARDMTATPDRTFNTDIADDTGIVLYRTADPANFTQANALDAVGFSATPAPYSEGTPLSPVNITSSGKHSFFDRRLSLKESRFATTASGEYSFVRKVPNANGIPQDTNNNAADFVLVATDAGMYGMQTATLGAPAPENRSSPVVNNKVAVSLVDPLVSRLAAPNFVRNGSGNAGTLAVRRHFTNQTGGTVSRLRFRVYDITTLNTPVSSPPQADLRLTDSMDELVSTTLGTVTVKGTQVEQPPVQVLGGGLNTSMTVALPAGGLANGDALDVQFLLNVVVNGRYRFFFTIEALP